MDTLVADQAEMVYRNPFLSFYNLPLYPMGIDLAEDRATGLTGFNIRVQLAYTSGFQGRMYVSPRFAQATWVKFTPTEEHPKEEHKTNESIFKECVAITENINRRAENLIKRNDQIIAEIERIKAEAEAKGF
ncbi:MAG: hypothetical protein RX318_04560 [bacterium]|nr:hypothetical protein [bacterium]